MATQQLIGTHTEQQISPRYSYMCTVLFSDSYGRFVLLLTLHTCPTLHAFLSGATLIHIQLHMSLVTRAAAAADPSLFHYDWNAFIGNLSTSIVVVGVERRKTFVLGEFLCRLVYGESSWHHNGWLPNGPYSCQAPSTLDDDIDANGLRWWLAAHRHEPMALSVDDAWTILDRRAIMLCGDIGSEKKEEIKKTAIKKKMGEQ